MKLSVIIPVYNVLPWLDACLGSVSRALEKLVQNGWETELVCVDDGSTDGSGERLEAWAANYKPTTNNQQPTTKILRHENLGVSAARNAALDVVTGDWVAFVDADDEVSEDWFVKLTAHARANTDVVHVNSRCCFQGRKASGLSGMSRTIENPRTLFLRDGWPVLNLVRRSLIGATRFRTGMRFEEDVVFFTELAIKGPRVQEIDQRGYFYRHRDGSAVLQAVRDDDCLRFFAEISALPLPRDEAARAIGFDLVLWIKGRDWTRGYDPTVCPVLKSWRDGIAHGKLRPSDLRVWWRPGLRRWLRTGGPRLLIWTCRVRVAAERLLQEVLGIREVYG